ncbi:transglycosylase domain-containing protein [Sphingomicrobium nitratireducens]|uniref:transglycosylase domain-containing protein n=1 Tax=Sphingomicrobium nitratireducens TaxID=2964666 RepID=UPI00223F79AD|nr:transglycosylase domain-containing protein [Sphingomicrobium nitratireducens]
MAERDFDWNEAEAAPDPSTGGDSGLPPADTGKPKRRRWLKWGFYGFSFLFFATLIWLIVTAPLGRALEPLEEPALLFVSQEGQSIARRGAIKEEPVDVTALPAHVTRAFTSIEDRRFYSHWGIDPYGVGRAIVANARAGGVSQGGSTITQQLAKTSFLSSERSMKRKAQEAIIALWLEAWLSKDEILSRYLSSIYFGDGVYGLRAASHHYFDREPQDLTVAESAMLAGIVKAPSRWAPTRDLKGAQERSRQVLAAMVETEALSEAEAKVSPARLRGTRARLPTGTYFADWVAPRARKELKPGYGVTRVPTTLDADLQRIAVRSVINAPIGDAQIAFVAMRPTGEVVAMVGGRSYKKSPFNRATQARRQPGSAFKMVVYLAALRAGWEPTDMIDDSPITVDGWTPANADGRYRGPITLREAFARSSNAATVRLAEAVGRDNIMRTARELGITAELPDAPSLSLGTAQVSLLEMTAAYAAVASGRYPVEVEGLMLDAPTRQSMLGRAAQMDSDEEWAPMLDLLYASANEGTGRRAALRVPTFGKTGTTQDNRDAVFIGFAGNLVVGVWVGYDDNSSLGSVTGGGAPARVFKNFMTSALSVDGARGPRLPREFRLPDPHQGEQKQLPSPVPEDWSDLDSALGRLGREIGRILDRL